VHRLGGDRVGVADHRDGQVVFAVVVFDGRPQLDRAGRLSAVAPVVGHRGDPRAGPHPGDAQRGGAGGGLHRLGRRASRRSAAATPGELPREEAPHLVEQQRGIVDDAPVEHQLGEVATDVAGPLVAPVGVP
jgi:hypothetical protein